MDIKMKAYQKYQIDWMVSHNITLADVNAAACDWFNDRLNDSKNDDSFGSYIEEYGFGGSMIWACYDEFLESEYQDRAYIRSLLRDDDDYRAYLDDIGDGWLSFMDAYQMVLDGISCHILPLNGPEELIGVAWENGSWSLETKDSFARFLMFDKAGRESLLEKMCENEKENYE